MTKKRKSIEDLTGGDLHEIFEKLRKSRLIFTCSFSQISKHFLKDFLEVNPFNVDFGTLVKAYLDHVKFDNWTEEKPIHEIFPNYNKERKEKLLEVTNDETKFHYYICKKYFDLVREPRSTLLEAFEKSRDDIREIDDNLTEINSELEKLNQVNNSTDNQVKKPILFYYKEKNERAKSELLEFLKSEIDDYALSNSYDNSILSALMLRDYVGYRWSPESYRPKFPDDLENKFGDLPIRKYYELRRLRKENPTEFYKFLTNYISDNAVVYRTKSLIEENHILHSKKEIILETLNIYDHGAKIMFAMAVPSIIEGIFHDLCVLIGEDENELLNEGFQQKVNRLQNVLDFDLHYEYYSFRFRIIRNKVSHGRLTKADVDELSDLMLLDLFDICKLVSSDKLDINRKRFLIDELGKTLDNPDYEFLMKYILLKDIKIPVFYKLEDQISKIEELIDKDGFWQFLDDQLINSAEFVKHGIYIVLTAIKKSGVNTKKCVEFLKKLGIKKADKELANRYIRHLTRGF